MRKGLYSQLYSLFTANAGRMLASALQSLSHAFWHMRADLDNRVLPSNTLILGLSDGLYIWPLSSNMRRTASGAVPATIPEPSPSPETEASVLFTRLLIYMIPVRSCKTREAFPWVFALPRRLPPQDSYPFSHSSPHASARCS